MKKFFTIISFFVLISLASNAQPWNVTLTIVDPGNGHTNVLVKGSMDSWVEHAMTSDENPDPTTWTYTYSISAAGDYEWGALADGIAWLLDEPYGTHDGNLLFNVDDSGNVTGETSFTLNVLDTPTETMTFSVDMNALITSGDYDTADDVEIRGNFNGWASDPDYVLTDDDADGVYSLTTGVVFSVDQALEFKFVYLTGGDNWESIDNRTYTVIEGTNTYCAVFDVDGSDCGSSDINKLLSNSVSVSPNPSTGLFNLSSKASYEVSNIAGKIVLEGNSNLINLTGFSSGMYFAKFTTNNGTEIKKLIVK